MGLFDTWVVKKEVTSCKRSKSSKATPFHTLRETSNMAEINWTEINSKLPTGKDDKPRRLKMFRDFDPNGNGVLSLAETEKGIRDVLQIDALFDAKAAIMRAFQIAKNSKPSKRGKTGDDYIELREFKYFLLSLRQYFEYYEAFSRVDASGDKRIELIEFKDAQSQIEKLVPKQNSRRLIKIMVATSCLMNFVNGQSQRV